MSFDKKVDNMRLLGIVPVSKKTGFLFSHFLLILLCLFAGTLAFFSIISNAKQSQPTTLYDRTRSIVLVVATFAFGAMAIAFVRRLKYTSVTIEKEPPQAAKDAGIEKLVSVKDEWTQQQPFGMRD